MRKDKYKIQVGDVLYEASKSYNEVFEWKVLEIWLEEYVCNAKTIFKCTNGSRIKEFFAGDVLYFYSDKEEAQKALEERSKQDD